VENIRTYRKVGKGVSIDLEIVTGNTGNPHKCNAAGMTKLQ